MPGQPKTVKPPKKDFRLSRPEEPLYDAADPPGVDADPEIINNWRRTELVKMYRASIECTGPHNIYNLKTSAELINRIVACMVKKPQDLAPDRSPGVRGAESMSDAELEAELKSGGEED